MEVEAPKPATVKKLAKMGTKKRGPRPPGTPKKRPGPDKAETPTPTPTPPTEHGPDFLIRVFAEFCTKWREDAGRMGAAFAAARAEDTDGPTEVRGAVLDARTVQRWLFAFMEEGGKAKAELMRGTCGHLPEAVRLPWVPNRQCVQGVLASR